LIILLTYLKTCNNQQEDCGNYFKTITLQSGF